MAMNQKHLLRLLCGLLLISMAAASLCSCIGQNVGAVEPNTTAAATTAAPKTEKASVNSSKYIAQGLKDKNVTDPHQVMGRDPDMEHLEELYFDLGVASGDLHHHTWYSDGYRTFAEVKKSADKYRYDFFACSEHNNWKQVGDELWSGKRNLYSMEYTTSKGHMNIYFPEKESLAKIGDFEYYDETRGLNYHMAFDKIPDVPVVDPRYWGQGYMQTYTKSLKDGTTFYRQLVDYVHDLGGFIQLCHPFSPNYLFSPVDDNETGDIEYFGFDGVEIFNGTQFNHTGLIQYNVRAYEYWQTLLDRGEKVYATTGSDTHYLFEGESITHMNVEQKSSVGYYDALASGNFSLSNRIDGAKIRMSIGDTMMGGTAEYQAGETLCVCIDFKRGYGAYRVNIYTDRGIAYSQVYSDRHVEIEFPIQDRDYYRVEIVKATGKITSTTDKQKYPYFLAFSQPIFLK